MRQVTDAARVVVAGFAVFLAVTSSSSLARVMPSSAYFVEQPSVPFGQIAIAQRGRELLRVTLRPAKAVKLLGNVDAASTTIGASNGQSPLTAGAYLFALDQRPGVYCAPISNRGLGMAGPCLIDSDGDGRFEAIAKAGFTSMNPEALLMTAKGQIVGANMGSPATLSETVGYSAVDPRTGISAEGRLIWVSNFKRDHLERPVSGAIAIDASARWTATGVYSTTVQFIFTGKPQIVQIAGLNLTIDGFDENGGLRFHLDSLEPDQLTYFAFHNANPTIFIPVYVGR